MKVGIVCITLGTLNHSATHTRRSDSYSFRCFLHGFKHKRTQNSLSEGCSVLLCCLQIQQLFPFLDGGDDYLEVLPSFDWKMDAGPRLLNMSYPFGRKSWWYLDVCYLTGQERRNHYRKLCIRDEVHCRHNNFIWPRCGSNH